VDHLQDPKVLHPQDPKEAPLQALRVLHPQDPKADPLLKVEAAL
tara:strand:+ start:375 stop:506 length:132 start_codon:yes stop_codon:yes gene_type:complete